MELRSLNYFLEIAREGSMTKAAEKLHVSQSALSKQMAELENELGKSLFKRIRTGILLTDEGMLLKQRAEDILEMVEKTSGEFKAMDNIQGGDIYIGCAESFLIGHIAAAIREFKKAYPMLKFHIYSGDTEPLAEKLDRGMLDLAVIAETPDLSKYNYIELPGEDAWGLIMKKDHPLASKTFIEADDLTGIDLMCSRQAIVSDLPRWCGEKADSYRFAGTTNLTYNGAVFVKEGLGCLLSFDHIADTGADSELCFRPLKPRLTTKMFIIWKKYQVFSPIANLLIKFLDETIRQ